MKASLGTRISSRLLSYLVILALLSFGFSTSFAVDDPISPSDITLEGSGISWDPYIITTCEQLQAISQDLDGYYELESSVSCNGFSFSQLGDFSGILDGRGYGIQDLTINQDTETGGLFSRITQSGVIKNLYISSATIHNANPEDTSATGILTAVNDGHIYNIEFSYSDVESSGNLGAVVGINNGSIDKISIPNSQVRSLSSSPVSVGGIAGTNTGEITNVSMHAYISNQAPGTCGGIAGLHAGTISYSYVYTSINCQVDDYASGGLVGRTSGAAELHESFSLSNSSSGDYSGVVGNNAAHTDLSSTYFDTAASGNGLLECAHEDNTCNRINENGEDSYHWQYSTTAAPLDVWDFTYTWGLGEYPYINRFTNTPTAPRTTTVTSVQNGNITGFVNGYSGGNGSILWLEADYTTDGENWSTTSVTWSPDGFSFSLPSVDVDHTVQLRLVNEFGSGPAGEPFTVAAIPHQVSQVDLNDTQAKSLAITWDDASTFSEITGFSVQYKKSSDSQWSTHSYRHFPTSFDRFEPLEENTSYDFRVAAVNATGTGEYSPILMTTTTEHDSYSISSCSELQAVNNDLSGNYSLANDIDCSDSATWDGGAGFVPLGSPWGQGSFLGEFDGNGHTISNLHMNRWSLAAGLFGSAERAYIHDFTLSGGSIYPDEDGIEVPNSVPVAIGAVAGIASQSTFENITSDIAVSNGMSEKTFIIAGGIVGLVAMNPTDAEPLTATLTNLSTSGHVRGILSGGVVGLAIPFNMSGPPVGMNSLSSVFSTGIFSNIPSTLNVAADHLTSTGNVTCMAVCGGIFGALAANAELSNLTKSGVVGSPAAQSTPIESNDPMDIILSILTSGGISGGLIGVAVPVTVGETAGKVTITESVSHATVNSMVGGGAIGITLPNIKINPALTGLEMGQDSINNLLNSLSIDATSVSTTGDTHCVIFCGGISGLSLGRTSLADTHTSGAVISDNTPLFESGHPLAACPIQSTGGFIGLQMITGLTITDSDSSSSVTSTQEGTFPETNLVELISSGTSVDVPAAICGIMQMMHGTGGIVGSFGGGIPAILLSIFTGFVGYLEGSNNALVIHDTHATGDITSNAGQGVGGLVGFIMGNADINNTYATGDIASASLYDVNTMSFSSGTTGGLIGRVLGGIDVPFDPYNMETPPSIAIRPAVIRNSYATGDIMTNNAAGGLIGMAAGLMEVSQSYATGDVYGTVAGGLIGTGSYLSFPLGVLGIAGTTEVHDTYAAGNVYTRDLNDFTTVGGGLIGFMTHFGQVNVSRSYSSGSVGVEGNATDTTAILGGLVGISGDMSAVPFLMSGPNSVEELQSAINTIVQGAGQFGITLHTGFTLSSSFTVSHVASERNPISNLSEVLHTPHPTPTIVSGGVIGATYTVGDLGSIQLREPESYITNVYYDAHRTDADTCGYGFTGELLEVLSGQGALVSNNAMCSPFNTDNSDPNRYVDTTSTAPLDQWNFTNLWVKHDNSLPTFAENTVVEPPTTCCDPPPPPPPPDIDDPDTCCLPPVHRGFKPVTSSQLLGIGAEALAIGEKVPTPAKVLGKVQEKLSAQALTPKHSGDGSTFIQKYTIPFLLLLILILGLVFFGNKRKFFDKLRGRYR